MRFITEKEVVENIKRGYKHLEIGFLGNTKRNTDACCYKIQSKEKYNYYFTSFEDKEFKQKYPLLPPTFVDSCEVCVLEDKKSLLKYFYCYGLEYDGEFYGEGIFKQFPNGDAESIGEGMYVIRDNSPIAEILDSIDGKTDFDEAILTKLIEETEKI